MREALAFAVDSVILVGRVFRMVLIQVVTLIFPITFYIFTERVFAQSVTAPIAPDQPLINPAAATTRQFQGLSINLKRYEEKNQALELTNSSLSVDLNINKIDFHGAWRAGDFFAEGDYSPQIGTKTLKNKFNGDGSAETKDQTSLTLHPIQLAAGYRIGKWASLGVKGLTTSANLNNSYKYHLISSNGDDSKSEDRTELSMRFTALGGGGTFSLFGTGLYASYIGELITLDGDRKVDGNTVYTTTSNVTTKVNARSSSESRTTRRDIMGIGYLSQGAGKSIFHLEASYERMPPLDRSNGLSDGELYRYIAEATISYFNIGAQVVRKKGYYVDPRDLIPYFFKFETFSNVASTEYGVFGGLKSSRGHSISASYFQSSADMEDRLSSSDSRAYKFHRTIRQYGLSYAYLF